MARVVTVAIPVLNGAEYLDEVLGAVRAQVVEHEVELLVVDSGSRDASLEIAERHGARVHEIPKSEFSHGGTRNLMMELARGDHVAFLTQDATPADEDWLTALLEGFEQADDVAAVFGPHVAREDASHVIKAEMKRHFENWGSGVAIDVQRLDRSPEGLAAYRAEPGKLTFLSSVNFMLARRAWEQVPFRPVPYAEDQLLGRELIESGFAKVFHPRAAVLHSHHFPPNRFLRRYFDEFRGLREVLDHREPANARHIVRSVRALTRTDREWLEREGVNGRDLRRAVRHSRRHNSARVVGAALGSRADRLPSWLRRQLSLEGRDTFTPVEVPPSPLLTANDNVHVTTDWAWEFVRKAYPPKPIALEPHAGRRGGPMTIAWVVPPWGVGSGGHSVIFELVRQLESRGHRCAIYVFDPLHQNQKRGDELRAEVREHFAPVEAEVFVGLDDFYSADVAFATNWWTAYPVRDLENCREKVYLVQDHEPEFVPTSVETIWAEETYRMGFRCVAYTPWLAGLLAERYGLEVHEIVCGVDADTYTYAGPDGREAGLIAVYARLETHRRGVELAFAGLANLFERRSGQRVVLYGSNMPLTVPFPAESIGVVTPSELAELYRRASIGVVFSLTNLSLVTQEMMASGLPVVELDVDNVTAALGEPGQLAMLAAPRPDSVADALQALLDDPKQGAAIARRAREFVEHRTWKRAGEQLEEGLYGFLDDPRQAAAPAGKSPVVAHVSAPPDLSVDHARVTELLYDRLDASDLAELERRITEDDSTIEARLAPGLPPEPKPIREVWAEAESELERKRLTLSLGVYYGVPGILARTGLTAAAPPNEVHLMGRGPLGAGGSIYHADLVADAIESSGVELKAGLRGLDFGCSSGRVVRVLAAAYPEVSWSGCDPIESSILWARENLPGIEFEVSPVEPPLAYDDASFDFGFAISIWSHFSAGAASRWWDEMHRVIRPGGRLVLTTHGYQTIAHYHRHGIQPGTKLRPGPELVAIRDALDSTGFCFVPVYGEEGDWGLVNPEWGMAYMTPDWLAQQVRPSWRVAQFAAGRNEGDQDVFVLELA
jgi:glycosyltransferase involved in cell wall biosynthesis/GT2 family glycosyltransferase/SAM-dependent methyltransferase